MPSTLIKLQYLRLMSVPQPLFPVQVRDGARRRLYAAVQSSDGPNRNTIAAAESSISYDSVELFDEESDWNIANDNIHFLGKLAQVSNILPL